MEELLEWLLETVVEIRDRHDASKEIENSLLELHQVFLFYSMSSDGFGTKFSSNMLLLNEENVIPHLSY